MEKINDEQNIKIFHEGKMSIIDFFFLTLGSHMLRIAHLFLKFESLFIMDFFNKNLIF